MSTQPHGIIPKFTMGDRLRKARELTGLSTREFADLVGLSHGTVNNAECDRRAVRRITLNMWSMATGVPLEWLEHGTVPETGEAFIPWAPRDSNPQPTDYGFDGLRLVAPVAA